MSFGGETIPKKDSTVMNTSSLSVTVLQGSDLAASQMKTLTLDCAHQISEALLKHHHDPARSINRTLDTRKNATMNDKQFQLKLIERGVIYKLLLSVHNGHILHLLPPVGYTWLRGLSSSSSQALAPQKR